MILHANDLRELVTGSGIRNPIGPAVSFIDLFPWVFHTIVAQA
jgi:hypothetical protein